jgi:hypothetical protein
MQNKRSQKKIRCLAVIQECHFCDFASAAKNKENKITDFFHFPGGKSMSGKYVETTSDGER